MTAKAIITNLLEDNFDPDDPSAFISRYRDVFEQMGFHPTNTEQGDPKWVWSEGNRVVEVSRYTSETAADADIPFEQAEQAGATKEGYAVWAYVANPHPVTHRHAILTNEKQAVETAARFQQEMQKR